MSDKSRSSNGARGASGAARDPHAERESERYDAPIASREYILETLRDEGSPIDIEALGELLGLDEDTDATEALRRRVRAMIRDGQLIENRRRGLVPVDDASLVAGRISAHPDGFGFLVSEEREKDVFLSAREMKRVLHGDKVVVNITGEDRRGRPEGRIVDVTERANHSLVGRLRIEHGVALVAADSKRIHLDLLVEPGHRKGAEDGDMVVAEITEQPSRRNQPLGRVVEVLGAHLTPGMEIDVALHTHGIPVEWPEAVIEQAASFSTTVRKEDTTGRKDVRKLPLVTIDGEDARDFDDAVWCEPTDGGWRLIVAIADVAHYVQPGSPLDDEAVTRGTSVYFPGRVVPMLPEVLSNGLCSLNPDVDRLCMLCEMTLDERGAVKKARFHNGVLRSHARLTYSKVHEILTEPESALRDEYAELVPMIENLHALYEVLAKARRERGAIEFESNETRILFDGEKKISELVPVTRNDAHKLIEECMILANIQAAAFLEKAEIPALYRVHNGPKADRLEDLRAFLALHGLTVGGGATPTAADYAKLSRDIADRPDRSVIQTVMLRSMQQAVYQPKNEGHFGLALDQYAHFTSPIRRYPDLLVHRAIKHAISREKNAAYRYSQADMQALGESCSVYERRAEEASRDVVSWLKCEYMQQHVGSEFEGVVASVTSFGLFVELVGIHVEGLLHITNLSRDYYRFDSAAHALIGERTGQQYHLGDKIVVRVASVNLDERKIDFAEVSHVSSKRPKKGKPQLAVIDGGAKGPKVDKVAKATEGTEEDGTRKGKSRKRRSGKRRRARERAEAAAEESGGVDAKTASGGGANAPASEDASGGEAGSGKAAKGSGSADAGSADARETNPEHRRQMKRREKQRRRDEKRAARRAEEKAAKAAGDGSAASGGRSSSWASRADPAASAGAAADPTGKTPGVAAKKAASKKTAAGKVAAKKTATRKTATTKVAATAAAASVATAKAAAKVVAASAETVKAAAKAVVGSTDSERTGAKGDAGTASRKGASTKKASGKKVAAKVAAKTSTAKAAIGKTAAKKASAKVVTKKAVAKKASAGAVAKKAAAKKASAKVVTKKATAKKASAGTVTKKAATKKTGANAVTKKAAAKKASASTVTKKATAKKAVAKAGTEKTAAKVAGKAGSKAAAEKASSKAAGKRAATSGKGNAVEKAAGKVVTKKTAAKKAATKKTASKTVSKKATAKKATAKKATAKKAAAKKAAAKKSAGGKKTSTRRRGD